MSIKAINWVMNLELDNPGAKMALMVLANYANEDDIAYPSQANIAQKSCQSERAVRRHLSDLESQGVISRTKRTNDQGHYISDLFKLNTDIQRPICPAANLTDGQKRHDPAANLAGNTKEEPKDNIIITRTREKPKNQTHKGIDLNDLPKQIEPEWAKNFIDHRQKLKKPLTQHAFELAVNKFLTAHEVGWSVKDAINETIYRGWMIFKPEWVRGQRETYQRNQNNGKSKPFDAAEYIIDGIESDIEAGVWKNASNVRQ